MLGGISAGLAGWMTGALCPGSRGQRHPAYQRGADARARAQLATPVAGEIPRAACWPSARDSRWDAKGRPCRWAPPWARPSANGCACPAVRAGNSSPPAPAPGLAAAFNAPLAGFIFVIEELQRELSPLTYGTALIAAVIADIVTRTFTGQLPSFHITGYPMPPLSALPLFAVLGVLAGLMGVAFNQQSALDVAPIPWLEADAPLGAPGAGRRAGRAAGLVAAAGGRRRTWHGGSLAAWGICRGGLPRLSAAALRGQVPA